MPRNRRDSIQADCTFTAASLFALHDGTLTPHEEGAIRAHLDACASCNREWKTLCQAESALRSARETLPSAGDLSAGFYAKLAQEQNRSRPSRLKSGWRVAVPTLAALTLLWLYPRSENQKPVGTTSHTPTQIAQGNPTPPQMEAQQPQHEEITTQDSLAIPAPEVRPLTFASSRRHETRTKNRTTTLFLRTPTKEPQQVASLSNDRRYRSLQPMTASFTLSNQPSGEIDIEVTDTERGFESRSLVASEETQSNGVRTVTFEESGDTAPKTETLLLKESAE